MKPIFGNCSNSKHGSWFGAVLQYTVWCLAAVALLVAGAVAQSTSQMNGNVTDPSGAAVPGAKITLTAAATGLQRTTTSNSAGLYQFLDMPPGTYTL